MWIALLAQTGFHLLWWQQKVAGQAIKEVQNDMLNQCKRITVDGRSPHYLNGPKALRSFPTQRSAGYLPSTVGLCGECEFWNSCNVIDSIVISPIMD